MVQTIGIDAGGSLIKIVYEEKQKLHFKRYSLNEMDQFCLWLNIIAQQATIFLTGGSSHALKEKLNQNITFVDEFKAITDGVKDLLQTEKKITDESFILVSIGTGTSIFHVTPDNYERITGTGIGGGTFLGLGSIIAGETDFHQLVARASIGKRSNSDLMVKDIYAIESPIYEDLTAANFGKVHLHQTATVDDNLASLIQMIGENILLLVLQIARTKNVSKIVFIGSTLDGNHLLENIFISFSSMLNYEPIFLEKGAFAGAIGALYSK